MCGEECRVKAKPDVLELKEKRRGKQIRELLNYFRFWRLNVINNNSCCYIFITSIFLGN